VAFSLYSKITRKPLTAAPSSNVMAENSMDNHYFDREHQTEKDSAIPPQSSKEYASFISRQHNQI